MPGKWRTNSWEWTGLQRARIGDALQCDRDVVVPLTLKLSGASMPISRAQAVRLVLVEHREQHLVVGLERDQARAPAASAGCGRSARGPRPRTAARPTPRARRAATRASAPAFRARGRASRTSCSRSDQRTESEPLPSAYTGMPASPRLRATGSAVPPPPSSTAGGLVRDSGRLRLRRGADLPGATFVMRAPWPNRSALPCTPVAASAWPAGGSRRRSPRASRRPSRC